VRRVISSGSVKAIYLDKEELFKKLEESCKTAMELFPNIDEIILFGSLARGDFHGLSDVDLLIVEKEKKEEDFILRIKPYFKFFSEQLKIAVDIIVITKGEKILFSNILNEGKIICKRDSL